MTYSVKEIFYTLQGEGAQAGMPAVFCRMAGCNLWSGREEDRANAICRFCDTDFVGTDDSPHSQGGKFATAPTLAQAIDQHWPTGAQHKLVVITGGEPLLQVDAALIDALHAVGFRIAVETNGSLPAPPGLDWVCVSPKAGAPWVQHQGDELKVIWPQAGLNLDELVHTGQFTHRFLQPLDDTALTRPTVLASHPGLKAQVTGQPQSGASALQQCIDHCLQDPRWRLSLQTHKISGIR